MHRVFSPSCDFINGLDVSIKKFGNYLEIVGYPMVNNISCLNPIPIDDKASFTLQNPSFKIGKMAPRKSIEIFAPIKIPKIEDSRMVLNINDFFDFLKHEENRIQTFNFGNWQNDNSFEILAEKGWFYTLLNDIIQCCFCRVIICGLYNHSILDLIHTFYSPKCVFSKPNNNYNIPKTVQSNILNDKLLCKICYEKEISIILNCFHLILCNTCANNKNITKCPVCCKLITQKNKVYF